MVVTKQKRKVVIDDIIIYDGVEYNRIEIDEWIDGEILKTIEWRITKDGKLIEYYSTQLGWNWVDDEIKIPELELMFRSL
jgi:hypothetical protein